MGAMKHQGRRRKIRSRAAAVRLHEEEWRAWQQFAATLEEPPSRILRRLLREALTGGPDYFKDELADVAYVLEHYEEVAAQVAALEDPAQRAEAERHLRVIREEAADREARQKERERQRDRERERDTGPELEP